MHVTTIGLKGSLTARRQFNKQQATPPRLHDCNPIMEPAATGRPILIIFMKI
jgi:hypothetical protein